MAEKFMISERYRLELHWESVDYETEGVCKLNKAYFSGPALNIANEINPNEFIYLDFCDQYYILTKRVYVAKFSWSKVEYGKDGNVYLYDTSISHNTLTNIVPKFNDGDYIVINTDGHQEENHHYSLVYKSYVINRDGQEYSFRS